MEEINLIPLLIGIIIVLIILLVFKVGKKNIKITKFNNLTENQVKDLFKNSIPTGMINSLKNGNSTFTTSKTIHKVKYVNGEKVSEETKTSHKELSPMTNCPNCGAKIDSQSNKTCHYCGTTFDQYQTITK